MAHSTVNHEGGEPAKKHERTTFDWYNGTAAEIVATGLVRLDQLPGQPGRNVRRMFYRNGEPVEPVRRLDSQADPENWVRVDRRNEQDLYFLSVAISREDALRRRAANKARWECELAEYRAKNRQRDNAEKEKRRSDAERELASMPSCREDFLRHLSDEVSGLISGWINFSSVNKERERFHGFMLTAGAVDGILEAFTAVQEAIERADVVFDQTLHQRIIAKRRHEIASADDNFQRHLALVATTAKPRKRGGDVAPAGGLHMVWSAPQSDAGGGGGET